MQSPLSEFFQYHIVSRGIRGIDQFSQKEQHNIVFTLINDPVFMEQEDGYWQLGKIVAALIGNGDLSLQHDILDKTWGAFYIYITRLFDDVLQNCIDIGEINLPPDPDEIDKTHGFI